MLLLPLAASLLNLVFIGLAAVFTLQSLMEGERRAAWAGALGTLFHALLGGLMLLLPVTVPYVASLLAAMGLIALFFVLPIRGKVRNLRGSLGYAAGRAGDIFRVDERDIVFARNRSLDPERPEYEYYYGQRHPEYKEQDDRRRARGGPLGKPGSIDGSPPPLVAMLAGAFQMPTLLGGNAWVNPSEASKNLYAQEEGGGGQALSPERAAYVVKEWAKHLGADLVGICKSKSLWAYSHRGEIHYGNYEDWGEELGDPLPYCVVIATEMDEEAVRTAPHTPSVIESGVNYAKGAYITTALAQWFGSMGFQAVAEHNRHYDLLMVPLAVDAGLGEMGRLGYLIADRYGPRVRVFAVQTDMPLAVDRPIDLGGEEFCKRCLKCAESCPSHSIPAGEMTQDNGLLRWKLNAETCFDYWGKVGTDCCVCMAVCPFSRPYKGIHRLVRWVLKRSRPARMLFPYIDNLLYGKRWKPQAPPAWLDYKKDKAA